MARNFPSQYLKLESEATTRKFLVSLPYLVFAEVDVNFSSICLLEQCIQRAQFTVVYTNGAMSRNENEVQGSQPKKFSKVSKNRKLFQSL